MGPKQEAIADYIKLAKLLSDLPEKQAVCLLPLFVGLLNDEIPTGYTVNVADLIEALEIHLGYPKTTKDSSS